jgi:hypothetical protein
MWRATRRHQEGTSCSTADGLRRGLRIEGKLRGFWWILCVRPIQKMFVWSAFTNFQLGLGIIWIVVFHVKCSHSIPSYVENPVPSYCANVNLELINPGFWLWGYPPNSDNMILKILPHQLNSRLGFINPGLTTWKIIPLSGLSILFPLIELLHKYGQKTSTRFVGHLRVLDILQKHKSASIYYIYESMEVCIPISPWNPPRYTATTVRPPPGPAVGRDDPSWRSRAQRSR